MPARKGRSPWFGGEVMLLGLPFLMSALTLATVSTIIFFASVVVLTVPVLASRGTAQLLWLMGVGFLLVVEAVVLVTLVVLQSTGNISL